MGFGVLLAPPWLRTPWLGRKLSTSAVPTGRGCKPQPKLRMASANRAEWEAVGEQRTGARKQQHKKLLILDVNGLLLHRVYGGRGKMQREPDGKVGRFSVWLRPHARDFVRWCVERFVLVVWSTAMRHNVEPLVDFLFEGTAARPHAVFDGSHCTDTGLRHPQRRAKRLVLKELKTVQTALGIDAATEALLIDDSPYKAAHNPPHTCASPQEWTPHAPVGTALSDALGSSNGRGRGRKRTPFAPN